MSAGCYIFITPEALASEINEIEPLCERVSEIHRLWIIPFQRKQKHSPSLQRENLAMRESLSLGK